MTKKTTCLAEIGVFGFDAYEPVILASLVTEDPLLLSGQSGTGKTFLVLPVFSRETLAQFRP